MANALKKDGVFKDKEDAILKIAEKQAPTSQRSILAKSNKSHLTVVCVRDAHEAKRVRDLNKTRGEHGDGTGG